MNLQNVREKKKRMNDFDREEKKKEVISRHENKTCPIPADQNGSAASQCSKPDCCIKSTWKRALLLLQYHRGVSIWCIVWERKVIIDKAKAAQVADFKSFSSNIEGLNVSASEVGSSQSIKGKECKEEDECVSDLNVDENEYDEVFGSTDDEDSDSETGKKNHESFKKGKCFKAFFIDMDKLSGENINSQERKWHRLVLRPRDPNVSCKDKKKFKSEGVGKEAGKLAVSTYSKVQGRSY